MNKNPLITIIVPVYNIENYIEDCIYSIIRQKYQNLEIILVDDGSTDRSGEICDELAKIDDRIIVKHTVNGGLGRARNLGVDYSNGDYILFVDGDDTISRDMLFVYAKLALKYNADVVRGGLGRDESDGLRDESGTIHRVFALDSEKMIRRMLSEVTLMSACGVLIKAEMICYIRFPEGVLYEDFDSTVNLMYNCNRIIFCEDKRYYYRERVESITNSKFDEKHLVLIDFIKNTTNEITDRYPELEGLSRKMRVNTYIDSYYRILQTGFDSYPEYQKRIKDEVKSEFWPYIFGGDDRFRDIIKMILFFVSKRMFYYSRILWSAVKKKVYDSN